MVFLELHDQLAEELTMNDHDHLEAVCVEAVRVELRDEELAEVSGGLFDFQAVSQYIDAHQTAN